MGKIWGWMPSLFKATGVTLSLSFLCVIFGLVIAVFLALGKISKNKILRGVCGAYIFFFRGTPLLMQLFFLYYTLPLLIPAFNIKSRYLVALIAFTLNVAAYLAEIIRAAIQSIDKGQLEASKALGLTYRQAMRIIIIPQAYRRMIPPICNEFVMVLKDTSLVSIISLVDLTCQTKMIASNAASAVVYIPAMIIYLVITAIFTVIFNKIEKKLSMYE
ncbi:MAG: amino acid ABC transporter permease [Clostridia bacterium]|nr:amino acid ABC transporter permease [Clostridia bacterium]